MYKLKNKQISYDCMLKLSQFILCPHINYFQEENMDNKSLLMFSLALIFSSMFAAMNIGYTWLI